MTDQKLTTVKIPEREALPVRAIPYVTGWDRFTPVPLVRYLAQDPDRFTEFDKPLTAYVRRDGAPVAVAPSDWDRVLRILKSFEAQTGPVTDLSGDEAWLEHAAEKIPAGLFVWLDEFTDVYRAYCDKFGEKNKTLDLDPLLMDDATRAMVMEGFVDAARTPTAPLAPATAALALTASNNPAGAPEHGLLTPEIAFAFDGVSDWRFERWVKNLSAAKWVEPARIGRGEQGGASAVWRTLTLAQLIHARAKGDKVKADTLKLLHTRFNRQVALAPWRDAFNEFFATFSDAD